MSYFIKAIQNLKPAAQWSCHQDKYDNLEWLDLEQTKPTQEEIQLEILRIETEYLAKEYQRKRAAEYPSYADQFDTIFHEGLDAWKAQIQAVKNKYPKGTV